MPILSIRGDRRHYPAETELDSLEIARLVNENQHTMLENYTHQRRLRFPSGREISTVLGIGVGIPAGVIFRLWYTGMPFDRNVFYILGLCLLGALIALWFRISRPPDEI